MPKLLITQIAAVCGLGDVDMIAFLYVSKKLSVEVLQCTTSLYLYIFLHICSFPFVFLPSVLLSSQNPLSLFICSIIRGILKYNSIFINSSLFGYVFKDTF
jgi:hypothetical protein